MITIFLGFYLHLQFICYAIDDMTKHGPHPQLYIVKKTIQQIVRRRKLTTCFSAWGLWESSLLGKDNCNGSKLSHTKSKKKKKFEKISFLSSSSFCAFHNLFLPNP